MKKAFAFLQQTTIRVCAILMACAIAVQLGAQAPRARITTEITNSEQTTLQGSLHPYARSENDAGRMPGNIRINGISMYFNRSAAQEADLAALLAAQQNPSSPQYHQWLNPDQFAGRFGMAQSDIDQVQGWLQQRGFSVDSVARSHNMIRFSGTVSQVESAFGTEMHYYNVGGVQHFAPSKALSIPSAIAPAVAGIRNLSNFRPRPMHVKPRAGFTSSMSGAVYFAPGDISLAYDLGPLTTGGNNGSGQSIAIVGQSAINVSDIENFQNAATLTVKDPALVLVPGTGDSQVLADGDEGESDIDVEWSGAMAQGANIVFVYVGSNTNFSVFDSMQYAIDEKIAPIISISYGSCEPALTSADFTSLESMFSQAAAQGQSVFASSGDQGSTSCSDPTDTSIPVNVQEELAVNYPASSAYVTGVGGTEITAADGVDPTTGAKGANYSTYWQAQGNNDIVNSLIKYIPEVAWNDDATSGTVSPQNGGGLSASGGGASTAIARPPWQAGVPGIASGSFRLVPDVALYSSPNLPGYLYCTSDTSDWQSGQAASCNSGFRDSSTNDLTVAGGTSFAAPIFAGMLALINQKAGYATGQGLINSTLYKLAANSSTYASAFHDITTGNNYCTAGSTYCPGNGATLGYKAGTGYDEVTGLGSVDLANLASAWPANTGSSSTLIGTTTAVVPSNATPNVNTAVTFTITVAEVGGSGTPTGSVTLQIDGGTDCGGVSTTCGGTTVANQTLASNGTLTYSATFTTTGTHQVLAQYAGDATHAASVGVGEVNIGTPSSGKGTFALAPTPSTLTVAQGSSGNETLTVTPSGGYTGTVLLNFDTSNDNALANLCYEFTNTNSSGQGSVAVGGTAAATTQLTLDTNAMDCASTTGAAQPRFRQLRTLMSGQVSRNVPPTPKPNRLPAEAAFASLLLAGFLGRYARKFRPAAWVLVLAAAGLALSACGGGSSNTTVPDPAKGTYTITVSGADSVTSTITGSTTFTFTIN